MQMEFEMVHWYFLSQWNFVLFYHSSTLSCIQSTQATKWLELLLFVFQCLTHGSPFVGDRANHDVKAFFKSIRSSCCSHMKRFWTIWYQDCLLKCIHVTWKESSYTVLLPLFFLRFYLFIFRERGKEREREGVKHQCVVASCAPRTGEPGLRPRHVPSMNIKPVTLWFAGRHSIHWATPARHLPLYEYFTRRFFVKFPDTHIHTHLDSQWYVNYIPTHVI